MKGQTWHLTRRAQADRSGGAASGILLDTHTAAIFTCTDTAWHLVRELEEGAAVDDLVTAVTAAFDVTEDDARRDTETFLHQLKRMGLADVRI